MENDTKDRTCVQFLPFSSLVDPSFWHKLSQVKLDVQQLNEKPQKLWGSYSNVDVQNTTLQVDCTSFNEKFETLHNILPAHGRIFNTNTVETFKELDKTELLNKEGSLLWQDITEGTALLNPSVLNRFFLLSFADLKKYRFYYWFGFLAPNGLPWAMEDSPQSISAFFSEDQIKSLESQFSAISDINQKTHFLLNISEEGEVAILPLANLPTLFKDDKKSVQTVLVFADPSSDPIYPGWPLRNLLALLLHYCPHIVGEKIRVLSLRLKCNPSVPTSIDARSSILFSVRSESPVKVDDLKWLGWERNDRSRFGPRMADISSSTDPIKLAENALSLNLKLMKWRLVPDLDLEVIKDSRCLLFGAGTLGCVVARTLLAWGVRRITFVDNGIVSYSNPARQSLFTFEDSMKCRPKAEAAAEALRKIYPMEESRGIQINIPMPGHTIGSSLMEETKSAVETIDSLVQEHDIIFLLTDSRESRWMPAMLAAVYGKLAFTAALGFDSYLVLRHGRRMGITATPENEENTEDLACYFCNDVTAPGNSQRDRTLDQQCTVTRPGVSAVAGALVVELAVSTLQKLKSCENTSQLSSGDSSSNDNPSFSHSTQKPLSKGHLGTIPHSVRGYLSHWQQILPSTERFKHCIACSHIILSEYKARGFDFVLDALNSGQYLEDLTGLTEMHKGIDLDEIWEMSDAEDEDGTAVVLKSE